MYSDVYLRTKPAAIRLDTSVRQLLGLELVPQDLSLAVTLGPGVVHLEAADSGAGTRVLVLGLGIGTVCIQRVLRLAGDVDLPLRLLHHLCGGANKMRGNG